MASKKRNPAPLAAGRALDLFACLAAWNDPEITHFALEIQVKKLVALVCAADPAMVAALALAFVGGER
jgi:hypothetical protein